MSSPFIGEIRMFAGNFAPVGWAFCDGAVMAIAQNDPLFNLIGTTYGGDGQTTFALPDLRGRIPLHQGADRGGNSYTLGQNGGVEAVTLTINQLPQHNHALQVSTALGGAGTPQNNVLSQSSAFQMYIQQPPNVPLAATALQNEGGSQPHENLQPYLGLNFIISLFGIFPTQN